MPARFAQIRAIRPVARQNAETGAEQAAPAVGFCWWLGHVHHGHS